MRLCEGEPAITLTADETHHLYNFWGMIAWGEIVLLTEEREAQEALFTMGVGAHGNG